MPTDVSDVIAHLSELPPFPKVTIKLLTMLDDPMVSMDQLAEVVGADPSLVMKVIHISNSPFYMVSRPIDSVKEAVFVLGINTIKSITTALSVQKGVSQLKPQVGEFSLDEYWKHSYATAIIARKVAAAKGEAGLADRMYLIGLIHDIGKVVQAYYWPETWQGVMNAVKSGAQDYDEVHSLLFACSHWHITAELCKSWQFPEDIVNVLAAQVPGQDDIPLEGNARILQISDRLAELRNFGFPCSKELDVLPEDLEQYSTLVESLDEDVAYQLRIFS